MKLTYLRDDWKVALLEGETFNDDRGFFREIFHSQDLYEIDPHLVFAQENHSRSKKNVIRGLHYQQSTSKLVRCIVSISGRIFDVAVDARPDSNTYGEWVSVYLDESENSALFIPEGFARGFAVLSEEANIVYKVSTLYSPEKERTFRWDDSKIDIKWPIKREDVVVSTKDAEASLLC